ncbi:transcriptional regulator [Erwiniaceae bacterium CAU 1747]
MVKYENGKLLLKEKYLIIKDTDIMAKVSKNQRILILCLMNEIIEKEKIIQNIWGRNPSSSKEKNYNQLVFQTRSLLAKHGFPNDLIMTIHRYGLCFNKFFLNSNQDINNNDAEKSYAPIADIQL